MAGVYKIGSKLGYDLANGLGIGQSVTATDGSVWTKNNDGSISVNHNGNQMIGQITYNPMSGQQSDGQAYLQQNAAGMSGSSGYVSPYAERLNQVISDIEGSKWEGWDANTDPSMQAYRKQYLREADRTTEDVLGQYAQNTGGIAGSQAIAAATQAGDYYKSQLADKVPELYENAYSRYLNEVAQKNDLASLLMNAENQAQNQYYQSINYALTKWAQMGYADQEVASILGVTAGTPTSDQSYSDWSTAFQREQFDYEKQKAAQAAANKVSSGDGSSTKQSSKDKGDDAIELDENRVKSTAEFAKKMKRSNRGPLTIYNNLKTNGYTDEEIYAGLISAGFSNQDIDRSMS